MDRPAGRAIDLFLQQPKAAMLSLKCPSLRFAPEASPEAAGQRVKCPSCAGLLQIPPIAQAVPVARIPGVFDLPTVPPRAEVSGQLTASGHVGQTPRAARQPSQDRDSSVCLPPWQAASELGSAWGRIECSVSWAKAAWELSSRPKTRCSSGPSP